HHGRALLDGGRNPLPEVVLHGFVRLIAVAGAARHQSPACYRAMDGRATAPLRMEPRTACDGHRTLSDRMPQVEIDGASRQPAGDHLYEFAGSVTVAGRAPADMCTGGSGAGADGIVSGAASHERNRLRLTIVKLHGGSH